jgi:hypothetical protein
MLVAAALLGGLLAPGAPVSWASGRTVLPGTLLLSGSSTGVVPVHVPKSTAIDIGGSDQQNGRGVAISGKGRFVGVVIEQHARKDKAYDPKDRSIYALRYSLCGTATCTAPAYYDGFAFDPKTKQLTDTPALPPGDYDIYLAADGQPVTVTLSFAGLSGSRHVSVQPSKHAVQWSPPVTAQQVVSGHGTRTTSGERGLVISGPSLVVMTHWEQSSSMERHASLCLQQNSAEQGMTTPEQDCTAGLADGRTVAASDSNGEMTCVGLCTLGLEDDAFAFGFMFFTEVGALHGARLLGESQAVGQFGYETSNVLVVPW